MIKINKTNIMNALSWLYRNALIIILIASTIYFLAPTKDIIRTLLLVCAFEGLALFLSLLAIHIFTEIKHIDKNKSFKEIVYGEDGKFSAYELQAYSRVVSFVFLGVHLLVGLSLVAFYFTQIAI